VWETSPRAWLENVRSIEMYHGLRPFCEPVNGMHSAQLNELLELRFEKKKSLLNFIVAAPIEGLCAGPDFLRFCGRPQKYAQKEIHSWGEYSIAAHNEMPQGANQRSFSALARQCSCSRP